DIDIPTREAPAICGFSPGFLTVRAHDADRQATPQELQRDIVRPTIAYCERMRSELGGKVVALRHPAANASGDATVRYIPEQRIVFATEFLADALVTDDVRSRPSACGPFDGSPLDEWIRSYRTVEALDFDRVAPGHGAMFEKAAVTETRQYF